MSIVPHTWTPDQQDAIEEAARKGLPMSCPECQGHLEVNPYHCEAGNTRLMATCQSCPAGGTWRLDPQRFPRWTPEQKRAHEGGKSICSSCGANLTPTRTGGSLLGPRLPFQNRRRVRCHWCNNHTP